jgi:glycosyl transferase family 2
MKLVMTLLARDEADVVDAQIAFHLNAGVDFVLATDNDSADGTREILERYARSGYLDLAHEPGRDLRQADWVTSMARRAAADFGADWVINTDPDEFWWPRGGSLKEVLAAVPERYGVVRAIVRNFPPRPDDGAFFADRMNVRLSAEAPINDPASQYRPTSKIAHRGDTAVRVERGNHSVGDSRLVPLRGWSPIEVLHFPIRSREQYARKSAQQVAAFAVNPRGYGTGYHTFAQRAEGAGRLDDVYESITLDDETVARGLEEGALVTDTRLQEVLRELRVDHPERPFALPSDRAGLLYLPRPTLVDDAAHAVDVAVLGEADVVRLQRRLDLLERRLVDVESRVALRIVRKARRVGRSLRRARDAPPDQ